MRHAVTHQATEERKCSVVAAGRAQEKERRSARGEKALVRAHLPAVTRAIAYRSPRLFAVTPSADTCLRGYTGTRVLKSLIAGRYAAGGG